MLRTTSTRSRNLLSTLLVAFLLITAGCNGIDVDPSDTGPDRTTGTPVTGTPTAPTATPTPTVPENGTDLRSVTVGQSGVGELDSGDPQDGGRYYERVEFAAEANTTLNITMGSSIGNPKMRLVAPNGTTLGSNDDGGMDNAAKFKKIEIPETGQYTIIATSSTPNATFDYILTVKDITDEIPANWNEYKRYREFAHDYRDVAADTTTPDEAVFRDYSVNTEQDYVVVTYVMDSNVSGDDRAGIDATLLLTYENLYEDYSDENASFTDETWIPDRVYHRAVTPDGELYRTTFIKTKWAKEMVETDELDQYLFRYLATMRKGPADSDYVEGADNSTTEVGYDVIEE
ncbi:PPC domain-containing protein [Halomicroarcula limicola]|uniref:PPC domain-containing protein n=1 Tax=Haloarcula limicola TaxID=1429915 RepID=A0A8J7YB75_9EURY|nr:PPC domain-containing protein [Halomicroarcula limicola]MBV0924051.1 PPC domain-containing protein [Halomicroarcula limicola]